MLRLLADENFNGPVVHGLRRRASTIDLLTAAQANLRGADDPTVLQWAADEGRVVLTHDIATMPPLASERVVMGLPMHGLVVVPGRFVPGKIIEDLLYVTLESVLGELGGVTLFLPL